MRILILGILLMVGCAGPVVIDRDEHGGAVLIRSGDLSLSNIRELDSKEEIGTIFNVRTIPHPESYLKDTAVEYHVPMSHKDSSEKLHKAVGIFLELMDTVRGDWRTDAVLVHCQSGLHRTGLLVAIYRIEYQGYSNEKAYEEMVNMPYYHITIHNIEGLKNFVKNYVKREDQ